MTTERRPDEGQPKAKQAGCEERGQQEKGPTPDKGPGHRETEREFL